MCRFPVASCWKVSCGYFAFGSPDGEIACGIIGFIEFLWFLLIQYQALFNDNRVIDLIVFINELSHSIADTSRDNIP